MFKLLPIANGLLILTLTFSNFTFANGDPDCSPAEPVQKHSPIAEEDLAIDGSQCQRGYACNIVGQFCGPNYQGFSQNVPFLDGQSHCKCTCMISEKTPSAFLKKPNSKKSTCSLPPYEKHTAQNGDLATNGEACSSGFACNSVGDGCGMIESNYSSGFLHNVSLGNGKCDCACLEYGHVN
jgi:hypothetical protein